MRGGVQNLNFVFFSYFCLSPFISLFASNISFCIFLPCQRGIGRRMRVRKKLLLFLLLASVILFSRSFLKSSIENGAETVKNDGYCGNNTDSFWLPGTVHEFPLSSYTDSNITAVIVMFHHHLHQVEVTRVFLVKYIYLYISKTNLQKREGLLLLLKNKKKISTNVKEITQTESLICIWRSASHNLVKLFELCEAVIG